MAVMVSSDIRYTVRSFAGVGEGCFDVPGSSGLLELCGLSIFNGIHTSIYLEIEKIN